VTGRIGVTQSAFGDVVAWLTDGAHWHGSEGIPVRTWEHLVLSGSSLAVVCLVALPLALWLGHIGKGGGLAVNVTNIGRAVPVFAVLVLLAIGPLGLGATATVVALILFGIPPVLTNSYIGIREVDRDTVEAARGMGMTGWQVLRRVELPLALPLVLTGIRLAAVQIIATATLGAFVLGGGLGRFINAGFGRQDQAELVSGAVLVAALALLVEGSFALLQRRLDPVRRAGRRAESHV
jgi:osmoprotectant transport system permease protein